MILCGVGRRAVETAATRAQSPPSRTARLGAWWPGRVAVLDLVFVLGQPETGTVVVVIQLLGLDRSVSSCRRFRSNDCGIG